jgi:hypothetical protein
VSAYRVIVTGIREFHDYARLRAALKTSHQMAK